MQEQISLRLVNKLTRMIGRPHRKNVNYKSGAMVIDLFKRKLRFENYCANMHQSNNFKDSHRIVVVNIFS